MKQLKELEKNFLNEIKPLVNQYIEDQKQQMSNFAKRTTDIRMAITNKTSEFKKAYTETWDTETREKIEQVKRQKQELLEERKSILQLRDEIAKRNGAIEQEERQEHNKMKQEYDKKLEEYKSNIKQIEELKKAQTEFEERYGDIDYITEADVYILNILIGKKEDMETVRISSSQCYDENGNVIGIDDVMDMQQRADEKLKQERKETLSEQVAKIYEEAQRQFDQVEAKVDEELREEARRKELSMQEDEKKQEIPKQGRIRMLWEKAKAFFTRKVIPALIEPIEEEPEEADTFKKELTKDTPPPKKQAENSKEFINRGKNPKAEQEINEVLTILD